MHAMRSVSLTIALVVLPLWSGPVAGGQERPPQGRWEKAIEAFERKDREQPPPKNAIVFVGSSSIRFWDLTKSFPDLEVINRGFGGSELADSAHYASRIVVPYQPRVVVLYAGDNDIGAGKTPERVFADFKDFVKAVRTPLPRTKIIYLSIKPSILRWKLVDRMRTANSLIEGYCKHGDGLVYLDVGAPLLGPDGKPRAELFRRDGLHLDDKGYAIWTSLLRPLLAPTGDKPAAGVTPLRHGHAHNDYEHPRPLFDALDHGFCSVEADVFVVGDQLLIGHDRKDLRPERTLEKLYLDPLRQRVQANSGRVYPRGPPVFLLVDMKTSAKPTYAVLEKTLARYADIVSVMRNGSFSENAVTVVLSGTIRTDKGARDLLAGQDVRYAGIDGRPADLDSTAPSHLMPWISERWGALFRWKGDGSMPTDERAKLDQFVHKAHEHGRLVRFWATPERPEVWKQLRAAGVDLINTDKLPELQQFLRGTAVRPLTGKAGAD
jgi:lysophospholipase L1-like esterase